MDRLIPESGWPARPFKEGLTVQSVRVRHAVRLSVFRFVLMAMALSAGPITARGQTCAGDCDGSGEVTIDELVKAVNIALGTAAPGTCLGADRSGDGTVTIDEIIVAVNYALNGCPVGSPGPSPTSTPTATLSSVESPTATPTFGVPNGIFWHPNSAYLHSVSPTSEFSFFSLLLTVDGVPESTAEVTLAGPGGTVTIPYTGQTTFDSRFFAQYQSSNLSLAYVPGATYTVTTVTSIGTASAVITAPGGITIAPDGSQVSWEYEGDNERIFVNTPSSTPAFRSGDGDKTSPFPIPVSAYGMGPGTYKVTVDIRRRFTTVTGGAPGTQFLVIDQRRADAVPSALGLTHTPTTTPHPHSDAAPEPDDHSHAHDHRNDSTHAGAHRTDPVQVLAAWVGSERFPHFRHERGRGRRGSTDQRQRVRRVAAVEPGQDEDRLHARPPAAHHERGRLGRHRPTNAKLPILPDLLARRREDRLRGVRLQEDEPVQLRTWQRAGDAIDFRRLDRRLPGLLPGWRLHLFHIESGQRIRGNLPDERRRLGRGSHHHKRGL